MFKHLLFIIFSTFIFEQCSSSSKESQILYSTINWHGKKYEKKDHLKLAGTGGAIPDKIHRFILYYETSQELSVDEARRLIVPMVEDLINKVNQNPDDAPYFEVFPITSRNVGISIAIYDKSRNRPTPPKPTLVYTANAKIIYDGFDQTKGHFVDINEELYKDALRIVQKEQGQQ